MEKSTNGFALIDRKTKKIVWAGIVEPKMLKYSKSWRAYFTILFHSQTFETLRYPKFRLIPVTITPKPKRKR